MRTEAAGPTGFRLSVEFTRLLSIGWVLGLAAIFLVRYDGWLVVLQLGHFAMASLPALKFGPYFSDFIVQRLRDFACVGAILAAGFAVGAVVTDRLAPEKNLLGALFALGVGLWIEAVAVLLVGWCTPCKVWTALLGLGCWLLPAPRKYFDRPVTASERMDGWSILMLGFIAVAAVLNLLGAWAPPFEYDELEYHLGALADYRRIGHIAFLPHNFYSNLPQLSEMLYLLATVTGSDVAAKLLHWTFGLLAALALYAVAGRLWTRSVGLTGAALFYCVPFVQDLSQTARVDLATAFFAVLAFGGLLLWHKEAKQSYLWLSALMTGAAVATKWPAVAVVMLPALVFIVLSGRSVRLAAGYGLVAAAGVVPWLAKNWLLSGNPVYPLLYNVFRSPHWSAGQAALFAERHYPSFGWASFGQFFQRAWEVSFIEVGAVPLLLMVAPLILLVRKPDASARRAGWLFVAGYAWWFVLTFRPWRFLLPAMPLAALAGAYGLEALCRQPVMRAALRGAVGTMFAISLITLALHTLVDAEDPEKLPPQMSLAQYALGQVSRDEFVSRMGHETFEPVAWMNANLPEQAKVLYIGEARAYYSRHPVVWATAFDQHPLAAMSRGAANAEQLHAGMRQAGVTHVYVNWAELQRLRRGYDYLREVDWKMFDALLQLHARAVHESSRGAVFELSERP
jgi:4-amino-4-deoxy-L-arabinose transferase-like glycosyltransferase